MSRLTKFTTRSSTLVLPRGQLYQWRRSRGAEGVTPVHFSLTRIQHLGLKNSISWEFMSEIETFEHPSSSVGNLELPVLTLLKPTTPMATAP